jgi:hypothetical protein
MSSSRSRTGRRCSPPPPASAPAAWKKQPPPLWCCAAWRGKNRGGLGFFNCASWLIYRPIQAGWMLTVDQEIDDSGWQKATMGQIRPRRVEASGHFSGLMVGCWARSPCGHMMPAVGRFFAAGPKGHL